MKLTVPGLDDLLAQAVDAATIELDYAGVTYRVEPPTFERQERLEAVLAAQRTPDRAQRAERISAALDGTPLPVLALGGDVVTQMNTNGMPAAVVAELAVVALIAYRGGRDAVDAYVTSRRPTQEVTS